jgi:endonuclease/exonuclease/phosphatase family metal-dependent hydrolase
MRNEQLKSLSTLMQDYYWYWKNISPDKERILIGDFNITPRSSYYRSFDTVMNEIGLRDISNDRRKTLYKDTIPHTRCHEEISWMCSHIDHIWSDSETLTLTKIVIPWSDHDGFIGKL